MNAESKFYTGDYMNRARFHKQLIKPHVYWTHFKYSLLFYSHFQKQFDLYNLISINKHSEIWNDFAWTFLG